MGQVAGIKADVRLDAEGHDRINVQNNPVNWVDPKGESLVAAIPIVVGVGVAIWSAYEMYQQLKDVSDKTDTYGNELENHSKDGVCDVEPLLKAREEMLESAEEAIKSGGEMPGTTGRLPPGVKPTMTR